VTHGTANDVSKRGRVVLADCHLSLLTGIHGILGGLFDAVLMVADESSLLDAIHTHRPDLAIVDLSFPRNEGEVNIVRRLMSEFPEVSVLVLSVHDDKTVAQQLIDAGAKGFVLKRSLGSDLTPAVKEVLKGGVYVSPSVHAADRPRP
jgi:DNA-binding NarL/FixJ family response regulator